MYGNNSQHQTAGATSGSLNTYGYAGTAVASESTLNATYQSYLQAYGGNSTYSPTTYSNASAFGAAMVENYGSGYGQANYGSSSNNIPVGTGSGSFGQYNSGYRARAPRNSAFGVQGSRSAWPRVKKPPRPPVDPSQFFCETCNITCGGPAAWQEHLVGKSHKRKEETAKSAQQAHSGKSNYKCDICNVSCTGKDSFETHVNGVKHSRAVKTLQKLGKPVPEGMVAAQPTGDPLQNLPVTKKVVGVSATNFVGGVNLHTTGEQEDGEEREEEQEEAPVGEEFLEEIRGGKQIAYKCKLCDCSCGDPVAKNLHIRGRRHRLQYKIKVDSSIQVDMKPNTKVRGVHPRQLLPAAAQQRGNKPLFPQYNSFAFGAGAAAGPALPDTSSYDTYDEQHVRARLEQVRPPVERVKQIEKLIGVVEQTLKKVSDKFAEEKADGEADQRLLRGVIRVGALGEKVLLATDRRVNAVLLCRDTPTVSLLEKLIADFNELSLDPNVGEKPTVQARPEESAFSVQLADGDTECVVTLSCIELRNQENGQPGEAATAQPADALPLQPCLKALADLRHTKFYQSKCMDVHSLPDVLMLLRDVASRIETWAALPLYAMELLLFKTITSHPVPMRVGDAFRRFFEVVATGQFMAASAILEDPCEKESVNALASLSKQQRENLVCSAQHGLRMIAYDQIHSVLGMERVGPTAQSTGPASVASVPASSPPPPNATSAAAPSDPAGEQPTAPRKRQGSDEALDEGEAKKLRNSAGSEAETDAEPAAAEATPTSSAS